MTALPLLRMVPWIAILLLLGALSWSSGQTRKAKATVATLTALRQADAANFKAAAVKAEAMNKATVAQVETRQAAITKDTTDDYKENLSALRAAAASRMRQPAQADSRRADGRCIPQASKPAGGADGQAMPSDFVDLAYTSEVELQLNALIDWIRKQSAIDPNAP